MGGKGRSSHSFGILYTFLQFSVIICYFQIWKLTWLRSYSLLPWDNLLISNRGSVLVSLDSFVVWKTKDEVSEPGRVKTAPRSPYLVISNCQCKGLSRVPWHSRDVLICKNGKKNPCVWFKPQHQVKDLCVIALFA